MWPVSLRSRPHHGKSVIPLTAGGRTGTYTLAMEWVLQVADEVDDMFGALLHGWLGFYAETVGRTALQRPELPQLSRTAPGA